MQLRQALTQQNPSLALQRAAADEIARLDKLIAELQIALHKPSPGEEQAALYRAACSQQLP